jgi:hypothetical protein
MSSMPPQHHNRASSGSASEALYKVLGSARVARGSAAAAEVEKARERKSRRRGRRRRRRSEK